MPPGTGSDVFRCFVLLRFRSAWCVDFDCSTVFCQEQTSSRFEERAVGWVKAWLIAKATVELKTRYPKSAWALKRVVKIISKK